MGKNKTAPAGEQAGGKKKRKKKGEKESQTTPASSGRHAKRAGYTSREEERRERKVRHVLRRNGESAAKALCQGPKAKAILRRLLKERAVRPPKPEKSAKPKRAVKSPVKKVRPEDVFLGDWGGVGSDIARPLIPSLVLPLRPIVLNAFRTNKFETICKLLKAREPERLKAAKVKTKRSAAMEAGVKAWEAKLADLLRRFKQKDVRARKKVAVAKTAEPLSIASGAAKSVMAEFFSATA